MEPIGSFGEGKLVFGVQVQRLCRMGGTSCGQTRPNAAKAKEGLSAIREPLYRVGERLKAVCMAGGKTRSPSSALLPFFGGGFPY